MTSVQRFINTGSLASSSSATIPGTWCRPVHKPTCCIYVTGGNACCMCVPASATCFIIEMWGQGGGGASGCCCGVGSYGGQGGSYGWVACTTSATNHALCACVCNCSCSNCDICTAYNGQFARVCNCAGPGGYWCVCGGATGYWCCNPGQPWCWAGGTRSPTTTGQYNTWYIWKNFSAQLAGTAAATSTGSGSFLQSCCGDFNSISIGTAFAGCASCSAPTTTAGVTSLNSTYIWGQLCQCSCFTSPYVWTGACGWSDPALNSTPFGCLNINKTDPTATPINGNCGGGVGVGGAAYAGGNQAWTKCAFDCGGGWAQHGNFPGGGGMSQHSRTAWCNGGCGGPGLILMSWC